MGLKYDFRKAEKIIGGMDRDDCNTLREICGKIREAENRLAVKANEELTKCAENCGGICCRNIQLQDIIDFYDFLYILTVENALKKDIPSCLKNESIYSSDCIFLENGVGPCIFPQNARPRVCIMTFCGNDAPIKKEIAAVGLGFRRLCRFLLFRRPRMFKKFLIKTFK